VACPFANSAPAERAGFVLRALTLNSKQYLAALGFYYILLWEPIDLLALLKGGTGSPDGLRYFCYVWIDVGLNKRRGMFFELF
jgi:hypothetical protein